MRVVVMGQAAFGEAVFRRLRDDGFDVVGASAPGPAGGREDPLWAAAAAVGVPLVETPALRGAAGEEAWAALRPDLCVMAFVTEIIPPQVLELPRLGSIQYHPSLLPLHRGSSAINWAIITGRTVTGLTIFWPDRGIDSGPVLLQRSCPIGPDDTVGSVYFERLFPMGVEAMSEAAGLVRDGRAPRTEQDHARATYEPPCRDEHAQIRWFEPADRIYALIRGCNPQPGAWTAFEDRRLRIFDCRLTGTEEPGMPGRVLRVEEATFDVRLNGGVLRVMRVQAEGGRKVAAGEWAREAGLAAGYRFR
jgi:methionyl-tRNA formyltransferase